MADACSICFTVSGHTYTTLKMVRHGWRFVGKGKQNIALGKWHFRIASLLWWRRVIAQSSSHKVTFAIDHVFVCWNSCLSLSNSLFKIAQEFYKLWTTYQKAKGRYDENIHQPFNNNCHCAMSRGEYCQEPRKPQHLEYLVIHLQGARLSIDPADFKQNGTQKTHPFSASDFPASLPLCDSSYSDWLGLFICEQK